MEPVIIVHGGVGDIPSARVPGKLNGVKCAVKAGYKILGEGGSALDAIEAAIRVMEDDGNFNSGYGSLLNIDGEIAMDATIMNGADLNAGAVTLVQDVANPISLARKVLECTPYTLLGAQGASRFAREQGIPAIDPKSLVLEHAKEALEHFKRTDYITMGMGPKNTTLIDQSGGTCGAVALDKNGNIAAATSTGGMSGKMVGRIGDTSQIGSGTYADNLIGGASTTGYGESIIRYCVAHSIIKEMEFGLSAQDAIIKTIEGMAKRLNNTAGAIALSKTGDIGLYFISKRMAWAYQKNAEIHFGINQNHHECEKAQ